MNELSGSSEQRQPDHSQPPAEAPALPPSSSERTWATVCHVAASAVVVSFPWGLVLGPLLVWLLRKNESPFVDRHGKAAVNFQLSVVAYIILAVLIYQVRPVLLIAHRVPFLGWIAGRWPLHFDGWPVAVTAWFPLLVAVVVLDVVCTIVATVRANTCRPYRYPFTIRFIR